MLKVGRAGADKLAFDSDLQLSRVHFSVECLADGCRIKDLKSTNGTLVNGDPIEEAALHSGDKITAGNTEFAVSIEDKAPVREAPPPAPVLEPGGPTAVPGSRSSVLPATRRTPEREPPAPPAPELRPSAPAAEFRPSPPPSRSPALAAAAASPAPAPAPPPTSLRKPASRQQPRSFYIGLYREHLEEASALYDQRRALVQDPEITWKGLAEFEERLEAHLDALVLGEDLALEVCRKQAVEGDAGELHAALSIFCRLGRQAEVFEILKEIDEDDADKLRAASDALNREAPEAWQDSMVRLLAEGSHKAIFLAATFLGHRRLSATSALVQALQAAPPSALPALLRAVGRCDLPEGRLPLLYRFLKDEDVQIRSTAALALFRLGQSQAMYHCLQAARQEEWPYLLLALSGDRGAVSILLQAAASKPSAECLVALGFLGDIEVVTTLLEHLNDPELAGTAALALNILTGAGLVEKAFVPEELAEDELFDNEREASSQGKQPTGPSGRPFGANVTRLSQNPQDWRQWWSANGSRFNPQIRYRNGKPYSPVCLLENLEAEHSPYQVRQLAHEELRIRYGIDMPFETDLFVVRQLQVLESLRQAIPNAAKQVQEGAWYFAGEPFPSW
jgi:uncharacterized protein (TIGR02270 family)